MPETSIGTEYMDAMPGQCCIFGQRQHPPHTGTGYGWEVHIDDVEKFAFLIHAKSPEKVEYFVCSTTVHDRYVRREPGIRLMKKIASNRKPE